MYFIVLNLVRGDNAFIGRVLLFDNVFHVVVVVQAPNLARLLPGNNEASTQRLDLGGSGNGMSESFPLRLWIVRFRRFRAIDDGTGRQWEFRGIHESALDVNRRGRLPFHDDRNRAIVLWFILCGGRHPPSHTFPLVFRENGDLWLYRSDLWQVDRRRWSVIPSLLRTQKRADVGMRGCHEAWIDWRDGVRDTITA